MAPARQTVICRGKSTLKGHLFCGGVIFPNAIAGNAKLQEAYKKGEL